ncbi:MAG: hypothetical protein AAFY71_00610 [Bacteroidota bacterium]
MHRCLMATLFLGMMVSQVAFAQENVDKDKIKKELQTFVEDFADAYASIPQTKNKSEVLKYFSKTATSNIFVFNISGKSRVSNSTYAGFEAYLNNILRASNLSLTYNVGNIAYTHLGNKNSTLVYTVDYETKEENGIWVKGKETVTMALERMSGEWKVVHYTIMQVEDEKLKGTCLCELFVSQGDDAEVIAKTTIPEGRSYSKKFDSFEFKTIGNDKLIKVGNYVFKRTKSGELFALEADEDVSIGVTTGQRETVLSIIRDYLYKDSCTRLKTKTNK